TAGSSPAGAPPPTPCAACGPACSRARSAAGPSSVSTPEPEWRRASAAARWFAAAADAFTRGRQPRTLVGWNAAGEAWLVTVDGRQPDASVGMTLAEAADFLLALGATDGLNLDGGGSTTFVDDGAVVNTPSD